jgi:hypothetical protein
VQKAKIPTRMRSAHQLYVPGQSSTTRIPCNLQRAGAAALVHVFSLCTSTAKRKTSAPGLYFFAQGHE